MTKQYDGRLSLLFMVMLMLMVVGPASLVLASYVVVSNPYIGRGALLGPRVDLTRSRPKRITGPSSSRPPRVRDLAERWSA